MTPEQEEQVRRALASLPDETMPDDVAARLDARLEQLHAERAGEGRPEEKRSDEPTAITGPSGDPARRNRRWPAVLVAAALIAVVGIGLGNVLDDQVTGTAGDAPQYAESGGESAEKAPRALEGRDGELPPAKESYAGATSSVPKRMALTDERVELHSDTLAEDVAEVVTVRLPRAAADDVRAEDTGKAGPSARLSRLFAPCRLPLTSPGDRLVAARLDGAPATLVLRAPEDGTRVAQVYSCDDPMQVIGSTRLRAR
jgi:hypothetical protein